MTEDEIVEAMHNAYRTAGGPIDPMRAALRIAIPWAREQALREAAVISQEVEVTAGDQRWQHACQAVEKRLLALIPSRPSQEP